MKRLKAVLIYSDGATVLSLGASLLGLLWAAAILSDGVFVYSPLYAWVAQLVDEHVAGCAIGLINLALLYFTVTGHLKLQQHALFLDVMFWWGLAGGFIASRASGTGSWLNIGIGVLCLWAYFRLGVVQRAQRSIQ
jgi:hypothetical protein